MLQIKQCEFKVTMYSSEYTCDAISTYTDPQRGLFYSKLPKDIYTKGLILFKQMFLYQNAPECIDGPINR